MANSQGFTLPFTGRLGKLTTGYRAGRYITRVIPDVKPTGMPTDEQVMQRDLFGNVSVFYSNLKSVVELGFASKKGGALNYAIKKNWPQFYLGADFKLEYNFSDLSFSEGNLAPVSVRRLRVATSHRLVLDFYDDYKGLKAPGDSFCIIEHFVESDVIIFRSDSKFKRGSLETYGLITPQYKGNHVEVLFFLFDDNGNVSNTQYCGPILYDW